MLRQSLLLLFAFIPCLIWAETKVTFPSTVVSGVGTKVVIETSPKDLDVPHIIVNNELIEVSANQEVIEVPITISEKQVIEVTVGGEQFSQEINPIPAWLSIIPPLLAVILALVFREVISSLFVGIVTGASIIGFYDSGFTGVMAGPIRTVDTFVMNALNDWSHIAVIVFSMLIGAVVSIISKNGGMRGVVNKLEPYAKNTRTGI